jgi:RNA polymerase sigma-70 factor (ECF subfamily)
MSRELVREALLNENFMKDSFLRHANSTRDNMKPVTRRHELDDMGSFDDVILPHLDAAYNLARWLLRNGHDAEDVVQEAYLRAFQYFGTFRGGNARAWLLAIVRNAYFRHLQKNRAQQPAVDFDEEIHSGTHEGSNPETLLLQRDTSKLLEQAMRKLPVRFREVLVLRELEGLSYREISQVVDIPMGTVMSSLSRAREALCKLLNGNASRQWALAAKEVHLSRSPDERHVRASAPETETDAVPA